MTEIAAVPSKEKATRARLKVRRESILRPTFAHSETRPLIGVQTRTASRFFHDFSRVLLDTDGSRNRRTIQTQLTVNAAGDRYEREADRVADALLTKPSPGIQRQPT